MGPVQFFGHKMDVIFRVLWLVCFCLFMGVQIGCNSESGSQAGQAVAVPASLGKVTVTISFHSDRDDIEATVPCFDNSTAFSVLEQAAKENEFKVDSAGKGETRFVKAIAGVVNLRSEGDNWIYKVNDQLGDKSSGLYPVKPDDRIEWSFGKYP